MAGFKTRKIARVLARRGTLLGSLFLLVGFAGADTPFTDVTDQAGLMDAGNERGLAWGDFDTDGDPDLYVAVLDGPDKLFRNEGDKTFTDVTSAAGLADTTRSTAPAWCDFDGDGDLDLYVARVGPNALYRNEGNGTFTDVAEAAGVACPAVSWGLAWGDHDGNGTVDLYVVNFGIHPNRMYSNSGDGTFTDVAAELGLDDFGHGTSAAWADFDNDGHPDLYLANKDGANRLFQNNGQGLFSDVADSAGAQDTNDSIGTIWGDCDNDGDLDLFFSANLKPNRFFFNQGGLSFEPAGPEAITAHPGGGRGIGFADYDQDGFLDLYLANSDGPNVLYRNQGGAGFLDVTEGSGAGDEETGTAIAWADYDGDGDQDLFLSNFGQKMRLFENNASPGAHWLTVRLRGSGPNTRAVGARVTLHAGDRTMIRENNTGGGYQSQSPHELHFGLGSFAKVDSLNVRWPSGEITTHGPYQADQVITLTGAW
jgi:hypothetical protein